MSHPIPGHDYGENEHPGEFESSDEHPGRVGAKKRAIAMKLPKKSSTEKSIRRHGNKEGKNRAPWMLHKK